MATLDETHRNVFTVEDLASHNQPDNVWIAVDGKGWDSLNYLHRPYGC
jgi:cytochrome b involved in lipid metabolism